MDIIVEKLIMQLWNIVNWLPYKILIKILNFNGYWLYFYNSYLTNWLELKWISKWLIFFTENILRISQQNMFYTSTYRNNIKLSIKECD